MSQLTRFGVSLDQNLLKRFDKHIASKNYTSRSKALIDLIHQELIQDQWSQNSEVIGTINVVFDHHKRELTSKLTEVQHNFHSMIISSQHIHLDHSDCLEIIVVKGAAKKIQNLANKLKAIKGVKHSALSIATTSKKN